MAAGMGGAWYGPDVAAYGRWRERAGWLRQERLFGVPIVTGDFHDSMAYAGNIYDKGGLVLEMLRRQMGDQALFTGLRHYLEDHRMTKRGDGRSGEVAGGELAHQRGTFLRPVGVWRGRAEVRDHLELRFGRETRCAWWCGRPRTCAGAWACSTCR